MEIWLTAGVMLGLFFLALGDKKNLALMAVADDSDMKIVGQTKPMPEPEPDDGHIHLEVEFQRLSGNLDKARELGRRFAFDVTSFGKYYGEKNPDICDQMRMLYAFTLDFSINNALLNEYVSNAASSAYLITLQDTDEWFFDHLQISGTFSLYLLKARKTQGNLALDIGEIFARFCKQENQPEWVKRGGELFTLWHNEAMERIAHYNFQ